MADVFISYAHTTARQAQSAAAALRALGFSVWLDDDLAVHRGFTHAIEEQLTAAKAALVIWSADAARSEWVLSEANRAREARKLVQVIIDRTRLPMPFDQVQCADLAGWTGENEHPNWRRVTASIGELVRGDDARSTGEAARPVARPAAVEPLLAVLAFDNLSGDPEMTYFSDGVSEEIQETVARGSLLKVVGRASSFQFRGADKAAAHVGAELGATHVLDGSVRRSGARVRISAQLVECARATTLWSDRFDRELTDIFELQDDIANAVAAALKTAFAPPSQPQSIDPKAYELCLRAREYRFTTEVARDSDPADPRAAALLYEQAVTLAPGFAAAWAGLAVARAFQIVYGRREDSFASARASVMEAAQTALELDASCGVAYGALALLEPPAGYLERNALLRKALALTPNDPRSLGSIGAGLYIVGRHRESLDCARRTYELDPLNVGSCYALAAQIGTGGAYEESQRRFDEFRAKWPRYLSLTVMALNLAAWQSDWERFEALAAAAAEAGLEDPQVEGTIRLGRAMRDRDAQTIDTVSRGLRNQLSRTGSVRLDSLFTAVRLGLLDEVFQAIDAASFAHMFEAQGPLPAGGWTPGLLFIQANRPMMDDPRFVGLCAKLGLADYWLASSEWPDCAGEVPYDFRAESRRLVRRA